MSASPDSHETPAFIAMRLRDLRLSSTAPTDAHESRRVPSWFDALGYPEPTEPTSPSALPSDLELFATPPWLQLTVHGPFHHHTEDIAEDGDQGTGPLVPAPSTLASFSSEDVLTVAHLTTASMEWPDFEPAFSLRLPSRTETPLTQWRALLAQTTVSIALCTTTTTTATVPSADGHGGIPHRAQTRIAARCHVTLAQLLLDTHPYQPVRAAFHAVPLPSTPTLNTPSAGPPSPLDTVVVQFFVEAQQVQTLQVRLSAVVLTCPPTLPFLNTTPTTDATDATPVPLPTSAVALQLEACPNGVGDRPSAPSPLCWAEQAVQSEATFRWTALPPLVLPRQTLHNVAENDVRCRVHARTAGATGASSLPSSAAVPCGEFSIPLSALVPASLQQAADARTGAAHDQPTLCTQPFELPVDWQPFTASRSSAGVTSAPVPGVVRGVVEVSPPFAYVQNGGTQYPYSEAMLEAATAHAPIPLCFWTHEALEQPIPPLLEGRTTAKLRAPSAAVSAPSELAEDSLTMATVLAQQEDLIDAIHARLDGVQRQQAAVLDHARVRRETADQQRTAAVAAVATLTAALAERQAVEDALAPRLHTIRASILDSTQQTAEAAAERRLLVARVTSERQELADLRERLSTAQAQMQADMSGLTRQSTLTKARVEGLLMESVLSESETTLLN